MLYGNIIFIKKTGGDGSKFPVTEKDIIIGRSEGCLIRIYNSQVAPQHCQLIVEDNGQATLKNLSKQTILNGKPFEGSVALCHGDVFQLGERLARWEYLPTSKYYRQVLSPTGRLVAVVIPQQRPLGALATAGTSASHSSVFKSTPLGKRSYSERVTSENSSGEKIRKSSGNELLSKGKGDLPRLASGRLSLNLSKMLLHKKKERKSVSGVSSKTPKVKLTVKARKSTLPSWKVNILSPERKSPKSSVTKSTKKSAKSLKSEVKTPLKNVVESKSSQNAVLSVSKSRTPQKIADSLDVSMKSTSKSIMKTPLKRVADSPQNERSVRATRSFSKSPKKTSPSKVILSTPKQKSPKLKMLVQSERKVNSHVPKGTKRFSLILKKIDSSPVRSSKTNVSESEEEKASERIVFDDVLQTTIREKKNRKSVKNTPEKLEKTPRKSLLKNVKSLTEMRTPRKSVIIKTPGSLKQSSKTPKMSPRKEVAPVDAGTPLLIDLDFEPTPKKMKYTPRKSSKGTPKSKTPGKKVASARKSPTSASREMSNRQSEITSPEFSPDVSNIKSTKPLRKSIREKISGSPSKASVPSPRGVRRKLSPSSSAERAAKMLKTSSPKKPDKNKKAALLVLGKANRKQLLSQNVKVLLKQKIVKKAIKQSTVSVSQKVKKKKKTTGKLKKGVKKAVKEKSTPSKKEKRQKHSPVKVSDATVKSPMNVKSLEGTPKGKTHEMSQSSPSKVLPSPRLSLKNKPTENSSSKQISESSRFHSANESSSLSGSYEQVAENYIFNSNRRSKRLSSKNDTGRPDFIELSPTALGLMPKHINVFKTPKENKRRSSSLVTPKNIRTTGIIKSASTSKLGNRKSVRFSSKDISYNSDIYTPGTEEKTGFDFSLVQTPDMTVDLFVSPLTENKGLNESKNKQVKLVLERISKTSLTKSGGKSRESNTCVRKLLQSPQTKKVSPTKKSPEKTSEKKSPKFYFDELEGVRRYIKTPETQDSLKEVPKLLRTPKVMKSPKNDLSDVKGVKKLLKTPKPQKSPKNDLSDVRGIKKLLKTPKVPKSPKNDLTDVRGVKKLMRTPKKPKSPKNDLTDVRGVKKLLQTPRIQKSPKNDLTDVQGVKKLMQTPRIQKSPKNDLTDVIGIKKLLRTPKEQKSPKNDLTDVQGVKKLLQTPRMQRSPRNDLTDLRGVKKLLQTPKEQKSPKNDLSDVRGVKKLLATPKIQKSPNNDLTNVDGVKQLLGSPRIQKSPKNDLSDLRGVKKLLGSPKSQKSPKNDLSDLRGVKKLLMSPRVQKSPKNDLLDVSGVGNLFESQMTHSEGSMTSVKQLLVSKSPESVLSSSKKVSRKPHVNDFRSIRGRRTIYSTPRAPKNDLSDVTGVRELFSRHKPTSDYNISLTGVAELFDLPDVTTKEKPAQKSVMQKTIRFKSTSESEGDKTVTRRGRSRKVVEETKEEPARRRKKVLETDEVRPAKVKAAMKMGASKKSEVTVRTKKETKAKSQEKGKIAATRDVEEVKKSLKRKAPTEVVGEAPPKTRRKLPEAEKSSSTGTSRRVATRSKKETSSEEEVTVKSNKKSSTKAKEKKTETKVQSKSATKTGSKRIQKVQSRSQSSSETVSDSETKSSRKTRRAKAEEKKENAQKNSRTKSEVGKKTAKSTAKKSKSSPVVKRSTRRK